MPELTGWEAAGLASRLALYLSLICIVGGASARWFIADGSRRFVQRNLLYSLCGAVLGFHAVLSYFLIQIGGVNQSGVRGMLDWDLTAFYLQLPIGDATVLRLTAFLLLLVGQLIALVHVSRISRPPQQRFNNLLGYYNLGCLALIVYSMRMTGHMALQPLLSQVALLLHVSTMSLWLGALFPLWMVTREFNEENLRETLERFSRMAVVIVILLLASALAILWQLFDSVWQIPETPYGKALLVKLAGVLLLLGLAGLNKWYLVPRLLLSGGPEKLRRSIGAEMLMGLLILAVTAWLSTLTGPNDH